MKILLTGATGFVGTILVESFLDRKYQVLITKRASTNLNPLFKRFGSLETCNTDENALENLFIVHPDIDTIVHAATDYGRDSSNPTTTFWANEAFPVKLLELAIRHRTKLFVNFDTFFNSNKVSYDYLGAYTLTKRHFQEWGKFCSDSGQISFINLRLFHLYGPGDSLDKFIPSMVIRCLAGETIDLTDGEQMRDFVYIDDAVAAANMVLEHEFSQSVGYKHYDLGTGRSLTVRNVIERMNELCNRGAKLNFGALPQRKGEFHDACADIKALQAMEWSSKINIEAGLQTVIDDVRQRIV